jgi:hypothetical protein
MRLGSDDVTEGGNSQEILSNQRVHLARSSVLYCSPPLLLEFRSFLHRFFAAAKKKPKTVAAPVEYERL